MEDSKRNEKFWIGYPVRVSVVRVYEIGDREMGTSKLHYELGLFAAFDLESGVTVGTFSGAVVPFSAVPDAQANYPMLAGRGLCVVDQTLAQFANHSCDPNCENWGLSIITARPVKAGEELTYSYDECEVDNRNWDPRWSFNCACGAQNCRRRIDKYVVRAP